MTHKKTGTKYTITRLNDQIFLGKNLADNKFKTYKQDFTLKPHNNLRCISYDSDLHFFS